MRNLSGLRVACFFPWNPFEPTGAWTRFSCLWRYLLDAGAEVTLPFLEKGSDAKLDRLAVRYLGEWNVINSIGVYARDRVAQAQSELKQFSATELTFLLMYEKALYLRLARVGPWLDELIKSHDVVTCDYPMLAPLISEYCKKWNKPLVVTCLDMLFELHGSHPKAKEQLRAKEVEALSLADAVVFCNDDERKIFEGFGVKGVTVLNTGDVLSVAPGNEEKSRERIRSALKIKTPHYCLFVGSAHAPNLEAAEQVRSLAKKMPDLTFVIAGKCHPRATEGNFIALEQVSDGDLDALYRGALAVIVPLLHGTGMSVKVFQAFTYGKAVVTTPVGARGFKVEDGEQVLLAQKPEDFLINIRRLVSDAQLRQKLGRRGREYALTLDFRTHFEPYGEIIARLTNQSPTVRPVRRSTLVLVDNNLADRMGHHFNYALSLKAVCKQQDVGFRALVKTNATDIVLSELSALATFSQGIHEESVLNPFPPQWAQIRATYDFLLSNETFERELRTGLEQGVQLDDLVFVPNVTPRQLLGLALLLTNNPIYRMLRFVVVLRYSVHVPTGPLANRKIVVDQDLMSKYATAAEKLIAADPAGIVRFATDSAELAKEYAAFIKRPLEVLPIPHTSQSPIPEWPADVPVKSPNKIRIVYLGDARDEKGFELLPGVVKACAARPIGAKVEFVFQAFISSLYHQKMTQVIDALDQLKSPNLHLIKTPLSPAGYNTLLTSADLVLLPYDAATYRARTSGPFIEAICADRPVVIPRSSWMSGELGDSRAGTTFLSGNPSDFVNAVITAVTNIEQYSAAASELGAKFRKFHNPDTFLQALMGTGPGSLPPG